MTVAPRASRIFVAWEFMIRFLDGYGASIWRPGRGIEVSARQPIHCGRNSALRRDPVAAHLEIREGRAPADHQQSRERLDSRDEPHLADRIDVAESEGGIGFRRKVEE